MKPRIKVKVKKETPKQIIKRQGEEIVKLSDLFRDEANKVHEAARLNKQTVDAYNQLATKYNAIVMITKG